ncbi:MAG: exo-alpha-sialidase [Bacteroidales bacterium]|nr:exo-alpha-sialidase [Bacteroidales bacterium]
MKRIITLLAAWAFVAGAWGQEVERVFSTEQEGAKKRIPAVVVTVQGNYLAATEHRPTTSDGSLTGIFIARRGREGSWAHDTETLAYNAGGWGKFMNPCFTVDAAGAHGPAGRVYLFFLATTTTSGMAMDASVSEIATCYVHSDDDGVTWSEIERIPETGWDGLSCDWMVPSPANGIQGPDGTLYIPCMGRGDGHWYSAILYKRPGAGWAYTQPSPMAGDNESVCYLGPDGAVYLNCRNESDGHQRPLYRFDQEGNRLLPVENPFDPNLICQGTICRASFEGDDFYLMSFCDPTEYNRRNRITVWASPDALHWTPVVRLTGTTPSAGYSSVDFRSGVCGVVWEHDARTEEIGFRDLTPFLPLFHDAVKASR